jgi:O-antigen/teichoic acid export membrane protein
MTPPEALPHEKVLSRVLRNAGIVLGGRGLNGLLGLGYMALTARALGASQTGALVMINAFAMLVGDLAKFQSWQTVLQFGAPALQSGGKARLQQVIRFSLMLDLASTAVGVAVAVAGALVFADKLGWGAEHRGEAAAYMLTIAMMVSATPIGLMRLFDRFAVLAQQTALVALIRLAACVAAYALDCGIRGFLVAWAVGQAAGFVYLTWVTVRAMKERGVLEGFRWRGPLAHGMPGVWRFAWSSNLSASLDVAMSHVATLMVGVLAGPSDAAFWRIGRQVADGVSKPARTTVQALYPELVRMRAAGDEAGMWRLARKLGLIAGAVGAVLLLICALFGPTLIMAVLGKAFEPAAEVMTWQVAALVIGVFALPLEPMLIAFGRAVSTAMVQVVVGVVFLAMLPGLLRTYGLIGAGVALLLAELALSIGLFVLLLRHGKRRIAPEPILDDTPLRDAAE